MRSPTITGERFEFRAWDGVAAAGAHLEHFGELTADRRFVDHYLAIGDPTVNAKVRRGRLKVKYLIDERHDLLAWRTAWSELPTIGFPTVAVHKHRRSYAFDGVRASVTDLTVGLDTPTLRTISVSSRWIDRLTDARRRLGLADVANVAMHEVVLRLAPTDGRRLAGDPIRRH